MKLTRSVLSCSSFFFFSFDSGAIEAIDEKAIELVFWHLPGKDAVAIIWS